jgi:NAD dependent epimerase/dehydratase family enzyme
MAPSSPLILLTGATGFLGRQILQTIEEQGFSVRALVRDGKQGRMYVLARAADWAQVSQQAEEMHCDRSKGGNRASDRIKSKLNWPG